MSDKGEREPLLSSSERILGSASSEHPQVQQQQDDGDGDGDVRFEGSCCAGLRKEFRWRNFGFQYPRKEAFYLSQWQMPAAIFMLYRLVAAVYILTWLFKTMLDQNHDLVPYAWPAYLTNWSYFVLGAHLLLAALISVLHTPTTWGLCQTTSISGFTHHYPPLSYSESFRSRTSDIPWYMKLDWLLFSIVANFAIIVTAMYWGALYPNMDMSIPPLADINLHAVNTVVVVLEILLGAMPVRLLHAIYPFIYGLLYMIWSLIFWAVDHSHVLYPGVLDWNSPLKSTGVVLLLGFVVVPLLQLMLWGLFRLRQCIYTRCCM